MNVLHLFCHTSSAVDADQVRHATDEAVAQGLQIISVAIMGAKADLCFMVLGGDLWQMRAFQTAITNAGLDVTSSYVSVTEVSEYAKGMPEKMINERLHPVLPPEGMKAWCFYPMSKRRGEVNNWYAEEYERRKELMSQHGASGKEFRGRVIQLVTGSSGLDDWEWGVTLFAVHVDDLKDCVYTMRFDEASTLYGEFGEFYTGMVGTVDEVLRATTA
jgi:hydrogen peroxide-dependent heme synthase